MNWNLTEVEKGYNTLGWMCRMLGYHWVIRKTLTINPAEDDWERNYPVRYDRVECAGSVVPQCRYQEGNGGNTDWNIWFKCTSRSQLGDKSNFYLIDKDKQHTQEGHGILMYNGGTVSGNKFDDTTAEVLCRIMGYSGYMSWSIGKRYQFQDSLQITLNKVNCLRSHDAFPMCVYGSDTTEETHENDIWLWCALPTYNNFRLGQKLESSNTCVPCTAGTYSPDPTESSSCLSCPTNSTSLAGSTFCSCNESSYMNSAGDRCLTCPEKSTSKKGSTICSCISGTYLDSEELTCVQCPGSKTSKEGSTSVADCIEVQIPTDTIVGLATASLVISLIIMAAMLGYFYLRWRERQ